MASDQPDSPATLNMRPASRPSGRGQLIQETVQETTPRRQLPLDEPPSTMRRLNGLVSSNGAVYCNCDPREVATLHPLHTVTDGIDNNQSWFGCTEHSCGFYLSETQAIARSGGALKPSIRPHIPEAEVTPEKRWNKANGPNATQMPTPSRTSSRRLRNQPIRDFFIKPSKPGQQEGNATESSSGEEAQSAQGPTEGESFRPSGTSSVTIAAETPSRGAKRKLDDVGEDFFTGEASDDERQMADLSEIFEQSAPKLQASDLGLKAEAATPTAQRVTESSGSSTPATARVLFPGAKRQRPADTAQQTPREEVNVTEEVMALLPQTLDDSAAQAVRQALERHAGRLRGAIKGRDAVRNQLKAKDDRIAPLQERVAALENKTKMQREEMTTIKAGLANLYSQH